MLVTSRTGAKRRHALLWMLFLLFVFGGPFGLFTANFDWPQRSKKSGT
jgi:hypothetical protein